MASSATPRLQAPASLTLPSPHLELSWRPLSTDDVPELARLLVAVQQADHPTLRLSALRLGEQLSEPWLNLERDTLGGFDQSGALRAYGVACVPPGQPGTPTAYLTGTVDPEWRGRGIGQGLMGWQEGRARQLLAALPGGGPCRIAAFVDESRPDRRRLYLAAGFSPKRWYQLLTVPLSEDQPVLPAPEGITVGDCGPGHREAVQLANDERFADLWGSEPFATVTWASAQESASPKVCLVALADGGTPVGFLHGSTAIGADGQLGSIAWFGVLPAWRHRGIGSALVSVALRRFFEAGLADASIAVDADYDLNASPVFTRLGFKPAGRSMMYTIEL